MVSARRTELTLQLDAGVEPVAGLVRRGDEPWRRFSGWLGLAAALEAALGGGPDGRRERRPGEPTGRRYPRAVDLGPPISYAVVERGLPVLSSDGQQIGTVEHVLAAEQEDIFDGVIIDTRAGPGGHRFADAEQVDSLHERGVVLSLDSAECERLPEPSENPAVMRDEDPSFGDSLDERLQLKLRRAWDYLTGNY